MVSKTCSACEEVKPATDFYGRKDRASRKMSQCKTCVHATTRRFRKVNPTAAKGIAYRWYNQNTAAAVAASRRWQKNNPDKVQAGKRAARLKLYGLTLETFAALLALQGNGCAVCGRARPTKRGWAVDHDHNSGRVRGILCSPCNTGIGLLGDTLAAVDRASDYLKKRA